jgi:hypothetical protein
MGMKNVGKLFQLREKEDRSKAISTKCDDHQKEVVRNRAKHYKLSLTGYLKKLVRDDLDSLDEISIPEIEVGKRLKGEQLTFRCSEVEKSTVINRLEKASLKEADYLRLLIDKELISSGHNGIFYRWD